MQGTLLLAILTVKGSYASGVEVEFPLEALDDVPDTVQWWVAPNGVWRIRTFAVDHDIHTFKIGGQTEDAVAMARSNNQKNFGDVSKAEYTLAFVDCRNELEVRSQFESIELPARLEVAGNDFAFWKPDDAEYATKTAPSESKR
jgi:hypothetical protein